MDTVAVNSKFSNVFIKIDLREATATRSWLRNATKRNAVTKTMLRGQKPIQALQISCYEH